MYEIILGLHIEVLLGLLINILEVDQVLFTLQLAMTIKFSLLK